MKRDFYLDVFTILNRIQLTTWTICAFLALNLHQLSLAKESSLIIQKWCPEVQNKGKAKKDDVINPQLYNLVNFNTENSDAVKTLRINRSRP